MIPHVGVFRNAFRWVSISLEEFIEAEFRCFFDRLHRPR